MMGYQPDAQPKLFYHSFNLDDRVPATCVLRKIRSVIDFDFIYREVKDCYGGKGNVSVPPPVILKMMLLLILYNVRSERELMNTLPMRLDWLWFLDYDLDSEIPNHSVLSKARNRWGVEAFQCFFERIVWQCVAAGLVDGKKIFMDASVIDANASNNSVVDTASLKKYLRRGYQELERRLEEKESVTPQTGDPKVNRRYVSSTDPDASIVRQGGKGSKLRYKTHRSVDESCEVITAVEVTVGAADEGQRMISLIETHEANTSFKVDTVVADSKYGSKENFLACHDRGIHAHMPIIRQTHIHAGSREGIFPEDKFIYDQETDSFTCPAGKMMRRRTLHENKQNVEYAASKKDCSSCLLRSQCTRSKANRTIQRHVRHEELNRMFVDAQTERSISDIKKRQHLMERSFARATRYGFKRARWRRLWRVRIQEYLTSAIQNIMVLLSYARMATQNPPPVAT
jgi:transposase